MEFSVILKLRSNLKAELKMNNPLHLPIIFIELLTGCWRVDSKQFRNQSVIYNVEGG